MSNEKIHSFWRFASVATFGWLRTRVNTKEKVIYLTFDDGPHPEHTPELLGLLSEHDVRASFFLVGSECLKHTSVVRRIFEEGHLIGNHTTTHPRMRQISVFSQWREYSSADKILSDVVAQSPPRFAVRPPSGKMTATTVLFSACRFRRMVLWSRDSQDYQLSCTDICLKFQKLPLQNGDVILFHDDSSVCIEVLRVLLPEWRRNGFRFIA